MKITTNRENEKLTLVVSGRVDTISAPELEKAIMENTDGVTELVLDLADMPYTSSAGLRVLLKAQKLMNAKGSMKLIHVGEDVMEILDMTGFAEIMDIES